MPGKTSISWTHDTWNFLTGCTRVAPECENCYAELLTGTRLKDSPMYKDLAVLRGDGEYHFTGEVRVHPQHFSYPVRKKEPRRIFVNSMSDVFHDKVRDADIHLSLGIMTVARRHRFQVLTKRPERMSRILRGKDTDISLFYSVRDRTRAWWHGSPDSPGYHKSRTKVEFSSVFPENESDWDMSHVWFGTSAGCQSTAEKFIPHLLTIPPEFKVWLSAEPLIGSVVLKPEWLDPALARKNESNVLKWVVTGGESGTKARARPMRKAWMLALRLQCQEHGVPVFEKQLGNWREMTAPHMPKSDSADVFEAMQDSEREAFGALLGDSRWFPSPVGGFFRYDRDKEGDLDGEFLSTRVREFPPELLVPSDTKVEVAQ